MPDTSGGQTIVKLFILCAGELGLIIWAVAAPSTMSVLSAAVGLIVGAAVLAWNFN